MAWRRRGGSPSGSTVSTGSTGSTRRERLGGCGQRSRSGGRSRCGSPTAQPSARTRPPRSRRRFPPKFTPTTSEREPALPARLPLLCGIGRPATAQGLRACPCGGGACLPGRFGCAAAQDQLTARVVGRRWSASSRGPTCRSCRRRQYRHLGPTQSTTSPRGCRAVRCHRTRRNPAVDEWWFVAPLETKERSATPGPVGRGGRQARGCVPAAR